MRRIGVMATAVALVVAGALPAAAAKPVTEDVIAFGWSDGTSSLTATATVVDGVGQVQLSGQANIVVDCFGATLEMSVSWSDTQSATFDLHPNGSSGTVTVAPTVLTATDCSGTPVSQSLGLTLTFDAGGKADDRYRADGSRVIERSGPGSVEFGAIGTLDVTVETTRTISG